MKFQIIIEQDEDGMFIAACLSLRGCIAEGKTRKEASLAHETTCF